MSAKHRKCRGDRHRLTAAASARPGPEASASSGERLQKILARAGVGSRRACEKLIAEGHVRVNGRVVTAMGFRADPSSDVIDVDGNPVRAEPLVHYAVNKPRGYISTAAERLKARVVDLVPPRPRVYPVGPLDVNASGLIILTNDGELAHRMMHPRYGLRRVYRAEVKGEVTTEVLERLSRGVWLAEGRTLPPEVRVLGRSGDRTALEVVVREGLKREVRRILAAVGLKLKTLTRVALGPITVKGLASGEYRELAAREIAALRKAVAGCGEERPAWLGRRNRRAVSAARGQTAVCPPPGVRSGFRRSRPDRPGVKER
jgi:23S rRNA pseudouridine2605 synthase